MSILTAHIQKSTYFKNDFFSLRILQGVDATEIIMRLFYDAVSTQHIPATYSLLERSLPSILDAKCFNERNYPFRKEVLRTEIGHLFEHILLEYLSFYARREGIRNPIYNGVTKWDWGKETKGVFHISIDAGAEEIGIFSKALRQTTELMNHILESDVQTRVSN